MARPKEERSLRRGLYSNMGDPDVQWPDTSCAMRPLANRRVLCDVVLARGREGPRQVCGDHLRSLSCMSTWPHAMCLVQCSARAVLHIELFLRIICMLNMVMHGPFDPLAC